MRCAKRRFARTTTLGMTVGGINAEKRAERGAARLCEGTYKDVRDRAKRSRDKVMRRLYAF